MIIIIQYAHQLKRPWHHYIDATDHCTYDACYMHCCVGNCNSVTCTLLIKRYKSETWVKIELFHQFINHPEECRESTYPGVITIGPWSRPKWLLDYFLTKYAHGRTFAEYEASCISFAVQGKTNPWQKTLLWVTKGQGRIFSKGCFLEKWLPMLLLRHLVMLGWRALVNQSLGNCHYFQTIELFKKQ